MDNSSVTYGFLMGEANIDVKPHRQDNRFLPFVVVTHINKGYGFFEYEGKSYKFNEGETMFVPECVLHNTNSTEVHNVSWAHVTASSFKYNLMQNARKPVIIKGESSIILRDYINKLVNLKYESPADLFERDNCLSGIFYELFKYTEQPFEFSTKSQWCKRLQDYISLHIKDKFNLDELAKELFISKSSLCHRFKKETGRSLIDYILQEKIKASFYMLQDGLTNSQIAENLNLSDEYYYSKLFKKVVGITPKEYKNKKY